MMKRRNGPDASLVENIELVLCATQPSQNSSPSSRVEVLLEVAGQALGPVRGCRPPC